MSDDSSSRSEIDNSCACGNNEGDGRPICCKCGKCHCGCIDHCVGPQLIKTATGDHICTKCAEDIILIEAGKPDHGEKCDVCLSEEKIARICGKVLCIGCLEVCIKFIGER